MLELVPRYVVLINGIQIGVVDELSISEGVSATLLSIKIQPEAIDEYYAALKKRRNWARPGESVSPIPPSAASPQQVAAGKQGNAVQ